MPSSVTLLQLEYFVAAVEHGSFSAAAAALHVAQPSLSEQIRRLEDRLGVAPLDPPMFETFAFVTRSGSRLSPATQEMIRMAAELLRKS
jgi:DNA-binding transcriptional LysR family regulator